MKLLRAGDVFQGNSHADMINNALGAKCANPMKSSVHLDKFGNKGIIAWFVHMDGTTHGTEDKYIWENFLSADENTIKEFSVGVSQNKVIGKRQEEGFLPYRLAFQIDPFYTGDKHCCKFIGAFCLSKFLRKDQTAIEYSRAAKEFRLGSLGGGINNIDGKELFIRNMPHYYYPIAQMGFSPDIYNILKKYGCSYAGELLELGFESGNKLIISIQQKLFEVFGS